MKMDGINEETMNVIKVKVIKIDQERKKVGLSMKI